MKKITSDALGLVNGSLGLAGGSQLTGTNLDDDLVSQVLEISGLARRGRAFAGSDGIFRCVLRTVHAGAGVLTAFVRPYQPVGAIPPWPASVPRDYDLWVLGVALQRVSGAGVLGTGATFSIANIPQGFGVDSAGAAVVSTQVMVLKQWDTVVTIGLDSFAQAGGGGAAQLWQTLNFRVPRVRHGTALTNFVHLDLVTDATAAATFELQMLVGLFPRGLGQDAGF